MIFHICYRSGLARVPSNVWISRQLAPEKPGAGLRPFQSRQFLSRVRDLQLHPLIGADQIGGQIWPLSISHKTTPSNGLDRASLPHHTSSCLPLIGALSSKHNHNDIRNQQCFTSNNFGSLLFAFQ